MNQSCQASGEPVDAIAAATWLQRESPHPLRVPIGVIGPRDATPLQLANAGQVGKGLAHMASPSSAAAGKV